MSKEMGPRERQLREQREERYAKNHRPVKAKPPLQDLVARVAVAAKKTGKSRKAKK